MPYSDGTRVQILGGQPEFIGKEGTVVGREKDGRTVLHRVQLDHPVYIPNIGDVEYDLWASQWLKELEE